MRLNIAKSLFVEKPFKTETNSRIGIQKTILETEPTKPSLAVSSQQ